MQGCTLQALFAEPAPKPAPAVASAEPNAAGKPRALWIKQGADNAARGELPPAPDFSAETHKRYRAKLAALVAMAEAGDLAGLQAAAINPISSSPKAMAKYRDLCVAALRARAG
ncbi:MAG: hypothetical protein U1E43_07675 [Rhodospirillales bacterium]